MAKVIAPNKHYTGISANVVFRDGVGETSDPHLISWFKAKGYTVEEEVEKSEQEKPKPMPAKTKKAKAEKEG